jgi:hypothetical protein
MGLMAPFYYQGPSPLYWQKLCVLLAIMCGIFKFFHFRHRLAILGPTTVQFKKLGPPPYVAAEKQNKCHERWP